MTKSIAVLRVVLKTFRAFIHANFASDIYSFGITVDLVQQSNLRHTSQARRVTSVELDVTLQRVHWNSDECWLHFCNCLAVLCPIFGRTVDPSHETCPNEPIELSRIQQLRWIVPTLVNLTVR